jgi:hypothetical protein
MQYEIVEDSSPFYARIKHSGIEQIIQKSLSFINETVFVKDFTHHRFSLEQGKEILSLIPFSSMIKLNPYRVSLFITKPGVYYRAHKDGLDIKFGINYGIKILDQQCITSWYSDEDLKKYTIDNLASNTSRECADFIKSDHIPLKTFVMQQSDCVLINTDIFHDFDNTYSSNERIILTLRPMSIENRSFDEIKKIISSV